MSSREAGHRAIDVKCNPQKITPASHFDGIKELRCCIAELLDARDPDRIAVFPSVSYGMAIVAANLHRVANISHKSNIVVLQDEFPNDTYAFCRVAEELSLSISPIPQPQDFDLMGDLWNLQLLEGITVATAAVIVPNVHWMFGVVFDLEAIANKCRDCGSLLIVDASQSVGALPLDVGYKWVFGPYSLSFGYFGEFFDGGVPVEESWMNRVDSHQFSSLTNLKTEYRPKAQRYNMGESSDFIHAAILQDALKQLLRWRVAKVQDYARALSGELVAGLADLAKKGGER
ncbi:ycbU, partial [Symbiodinium microadriaticum]